MLPERKELFHKNYWVISLFFRVAKNAGNRGAFGKACCFDVPCVGVLEIGFSPVVVFYGGNFPANGGEQDQRRGVAAALRRLVLNPRSASGRRE